MASNRASQMSKIGIVSIIALGLREAGAWPRRISARKELASLSPYHLNDIGLIPWDVERETRKPFWQA